MQTLSSLTSTIRRFLRDERGATAIEYAIMASGIAVAIVATDASLGSSVSGLFTKVNSAYPG